MFLKKRTRVRAIALAAFAVMALSTVLAGCGGGAGGTGGGGGAKTEVGTPRDKTLVLDIGKDSNPGQFNPYMPGTAQSNGLHQLATSHLWEIDSQKGTQFPDLAAEMPVANADFTEFTVKLREGIKWSDGKPFTADDVVFTSDLLLTNDKLTYHGMFSSVIKKIEKVADYEIKIITHEPYPRISSFLGVMIWGNSFYILPKHIWESQDAATFKFNPPVHTGPYKLEKFDEQQGAWFLWKLRDDWKSSDVGVINPDKKPGPDWVWARNFGDEQKRVMAVTNNEIDVMMEVSPESWEALQKSNKEVRMWHAGFPYAIFDDPCGKGIEFNCDKKPYDDINFRWGMALAVNIKEVSMETMKGMLRVNPLLIPPTDALQATYHDPMRQWLTDFKLEDGYQPFDPNYAKDIAAMLTSQGIKDLPTDEAALVKLFGVGWWKYDPDKAAELLTKAGLEKKDDGWYYEGKKFGFEVNIPESTEIEANRLGTAMANQWRKFGIDATPAMKAGAAFGDAENSGEFEVGSYWPGCGIIPDVYTHINGWDKRLYKPNGELAVGTRSRYQSDALTESLDKLKGMSPTDPAVVEETTKFLQTFVTELPYINCFGQSKFVPVNEHYWTNFPTAENAYNGPWWWWSCFKFILSDVKAKTAS